jgi:hypothetical protein
VSGRVAPYGRLCAEFYDLDKPLPPRAELEVWLAACRRAAGPVLEAMCGSGRFLIPLLQAGIPVDGADSSEAMLGACARRAAAAGLKPSLVLQRIEDLNLPGRYALVFVAGGSLALVVDRTVETLRRVRAHLMPGGRFLTDLDEYVPGRSGGARAVVDSRGGSIHLGWSETGSAEPGVSEVECRYDRYRGNEIVETEVETLRLRRRTTAELQENLEQAGFHGVQFEPGPNGWLVEATA